MERIMEGSGGDFLLHSGCVSVPLSGAPTHTRAYNPGLCERHPETSACGIPDNQAGVYCVVYSRNRDALIQTDTLVKEKFPKGRSRYPGAFCRPFAKNLYIPGIWTRMGEASRDVPPPDARTNDTLNWVSGNFCRCAAL